MNRLSATAILAGATLLSSVNIVHAQDAETQGREDEDVVQQDTTGDGISLGLITIFGDRQGRKPLDVNANITVIGQEQLADRFSNDIQELVRYEPGVQVIRQTTGTDPFNTFSGFNIRGVGGNRVQLLVDGARIPERIIDGTRDYFDFNFTKQADIVRGPGSVLWGADALGGIVAVETIDPEDVLFDGRDMGGNLETSFDSLDNEINTAATFASQLTETLSFLGGIAYTHANEAKFGKARADGGIYGCPRNLDFGATPCNELDPTDKSSVRGLGKLVFTPFSNHRFELSADYLSRVTDVQYDNVLGPQFSSFTGNPTGVVVDDYDRKLDLYRGRFALEHQWGLGTAFIDDVKWVLSYSPSGYERTGTETKTLANDDDVIEEDFLSFAEKFGELDIQFTSRFDPGGIPNTVTWGFDGDITRTDYQRIDVVRNLTQDTVTETRGGGFNFANATTVRADFYIQDQIELLGGRFELTPGMRHAYYNLDPRPDPDYQPVVGSEPVEVSKSKVLFAVGGNFDLTDQYSLYAAFNQGFKMPTAQQLYTSLPGTFFNLIPAPDLRPESVDNYEIGLRGKFGRGFFSINGFYADYTDFIQAFFNIPGTNDFTYRNLSSVELWGIEATAGYQFTDALRGDISLTWQEGVQKVNPESPTTPYTAPPLEVVAGLSYEFIEQNLTLEAIGIFAADVERNSNPNNFNPDGYAVFDLHGKWRPLDNTIFRFGVKNVFDTRYFQASAANFGRTASDAVARTNPIELQTGPGRTFHASLNVLF